MVATVHKLFPNRPVEPSLAATGESELPAVLEVRAGLPDAAGLAAELRAGPNRLRLEGRLPPARSGAGARSRAPVLIVGAGFAGLYMLHRLRQAGLKAICFEAGEGVGGTWYWNRYPGAACDFESVEYSYSFDEALQQEWKWTTRMARQPEILAYLNHVTDRYDLRRDIHFGTRVLSAHFDDATALWTVSTDRGHRVTARHVVMATGCLSTPKPIEYPGADSYKGQILRTAFWPKEDVDFRGKRVGVVGTGSSAIQAIPIIAEQAAQLTVFQRTPNFSIPAGNGPLSDEEGQRQKAGYAELRAREWDSDVGICAKLGPETRKALAVKDFLIDVFERNSAGQRGGARREDRRRRYSGDNALRVAADTGVDRRLFHETVPLDLAAGAGVKDLDLQHHCPSGRAQRGPGIAPYRGVRRAAAAPRAVLA